MRLFLESADAGEIRACVAQGIVPGVMTTAVRISRTGRERLELLLEVCEVVAGPVTAEVGGADAEEMGRDARGLAAVAPNLIVALPFSNPTLEIVRGLAAERIKTLVTGCLDAGQALLAARAGAGRVCPAVRSASADGGHLSGPSATGDVVRKIVASFRSYRLAAEVWVTSVGNGDAALDAALGGAEVVAVPETLLRELVKGKLAAAGQLTP